MEQCFKKMNFCCNIYKRISRHEVSCLCTFSYRPQEGKKKKKGKLRKEDISLPTNFQHISHVGWDPNKGFDLENVDPKLKQFFSKAGKSIITYLFTTRFSICIIYQNIVKWHESISRNFWTFLIRHLFTFFQVYQKENYKTKTPEILFMILLTDTVVSKQLLRKLKIEIELRHRPLLQGKVL